jgi:1-acyl-sn-glycerol-3-phosphate acyltransferase
MAKRSELDLPTVGSRDLHLTEAPQPGPGSEALGADDLFEAEQDSLTIRQIWDLVDRLAKRPGIEGALAALQEAGPEGLRDAVRRALTARAERPIDRFGFDLAYYEELFPLARWAHDHYFRVETRGIEHIADQGRVLVVANHSGTLPYDGCMIHATTRIHHPSKRLLRPLVENFVYHMPFVGRFMARCGAVRACQENAQALLEADEAVLVFPEGVKGIGKLYKRRYRLQRFGRGGAVKLAMRTGSPIVPCAVVGAEESMPLLSKVSWLARPLGLPYIPVTPTLPLLGPLGLLPLPTKWWIDFAEPIDVSQYGPDAIRDRVLVNRLNEEVRAAIQSMITHRLERRQSVFLG